MIRRRASQLSIDDLLAFGRYRSARELLSPRFRRIDELLDDSELVDSVYSLLGKRHPGSRGQGRPGTPAEVVLRMLVLKHLKGWSYEELEWEVRGSLGYRYFCRVGMGEVPDAKTMVRLGQLFAGEDLKAVFDRVVAMAVERKVTSGRRMRADTTVVEAPIRPPTDSRLCEDTIRVTRRSIERIAKEGVKLPFRLARIRTALSRRMREVTQAKRRVRSNPDALKRPYRGLLKLTRKALLQATMAIECATKALTRKRRKARKALVREIQRLSKFVELGQTVVRQTRARIFSGQTRSPEKLISLFEPSARILRRGKPHQPTEFGQMVQVQEAEGSIVTDIYTTTNHDTALLVPAVDRHIDVFGSPPRMLSMDRGFYSGAGVRAAEERGVRRVVVPKPGYKSKERTRHERERWFKRGRAWRSGSEARISRLKNHFGMKRSRYRGQEGIERTARWAGVANNLEAIAAAM
jgi:transposase, IS5 family